MDRIERDAICKIAEAHGLSCEYLKSKPKKSLSQVKAAQQIGWTRNQWNAHKETWLTRGLPYPLYEGADRQKVFVDAGKLDAWVQARDEVLAADAKLTKERRAAAIREAQNITDIKGDPQQAKFEQEARLKAIQVAKECGALIPKTRLRDHLGVISAAMNEALEQNFAEAERAAANVDDGDSAVKVVRDLKKGILAGYQRNVKEGMALLKEEYESAKDGA